MALDVNVWTLHTDVNVEGFVDELLPWRPPLNIPMEGSVNVDICFDVDVEVDVYEPGNHSIQN